MRQMRTPRAYARVRGCVILLIANTVTRLRMRSFPVRPGIASETAAHAGPFKSGFRNHYLLKGGEFFGGAATVPTYKMIENGFPVIMRDPEGKPLAGEIYIVDDNTLARLDQLEREGGSYDRKLIDATLSLVNGEHLPTKAFIYVGREDRFGKAFARGPLYETVNERGELDWKPA